MAVVQPFPAAIDVSDHAVVRWIERVMGADVEEIRAEIRRACAVGGLGHLGELEAEAAVYIDVPDHGVHLVARSGVICTVFKSGAEPD